MYDHPVPSFELDRDVAQLCLRAIVTCARADGDLADQERRLSEVVGQALGSRRSRSRRSPRLRSTRSRASSLRRSPRLFLIRWSASASSKR